MKSLYLLSKKFNFNEVQFVIQLIEVFLFFALIFSKHNSYLFTLGIIINLNIFCPLYINANPLENPPKQENDEFQSSSLKKEDNQNLESVSLNTDGNDTAYFEGDNVNYDPETGSFTIEGNGILYLTKQNTKLSADRIEYLPKQERLKAFGNVMVTNKDQVTFSENLDLDLNDNNALLGNIKSQIALASIEARSANLQSGKTYRNGNYNDGNFDLAQPFRLGSQPQGVLSYRLQENIQESPEEILKNGESFSLQARKLIYYPDRIQNNLYVYGARLKFKKVPITLPLPFGVFTAGESTQQMFSLVMGNSPRTGAGDFNIGPKVSFVLGDPQKKRAISLAPFFQMGSSMGLGGMVQYTDPKNNALLGYGSAKGRGLAEITSHLTKYNDFIYGWNSYIGGGITKQLIQLNDNRNIKIPLLSSFLEGNAINTRSDITFAVDSQELRNRENNLFSRLQRDSLGANNLKDKTGFRFQEFISLTTKPIIEIGTEKYNIGLRARGYGAIRAYTTGNFNAFASIGPNIKIKANRFATVDFGYDQLMNTGKSPFGFDQMIQGQESIYSNADINLTKWLTIGNYSVYSLSRKNWIVQQSRLVIGPEDFKILFGYDPVRKQVNFGFTVFFDDKVGFKQFSYRKNTNGKKHRF